MRHLLLVIAFLSIVGWGPFTFFTSSSDSNENSAMGDSHNLGWIEQETKVFNRQADNLDPKVLKLSLTAYSHARSRGIANKNYLTIIDYSKPSTERRLWVLDMKNNRVLYNTWVSHGKNSGGVKAESFSNVEGSLKSSLGVFLTENTYMGGNGYSLRLIGLERGINDNAYNRDIVVHGAWYASGRVVQQYGQLGRSWGCPAVDDALARPLIDTIKGNSLLVAYYPDRTWLNKSSYLS